MSPDPTEISKRLSELQSLVDAMCGVDAEAEDALDRKEFEDQELRSTIAELEALRDANPSQENEALGFAFAYACDLLDKGTDPRAYALPAVLEAWRNAKISRETAVSFVPAKAHVAIDLSEPEDPPRAIAAQIDANWVEEFENARGPETRSLWAAVAAVRRSALSATAPGLDPAERLKRAQATYTQAQELTEAVRALNRARRPERGLL